MHTWICYNEHTSSTGYVISHYIVSFYIIPYHITSEIEALEHVLHTWMGCERGEGKDSYIWQSRGYDPKVLGWMTISTPTALQLHAGPCLGLGYQNPVASESSCRIQLGLRVKSRFHGEIIFNYPRNQSTDEYISLTGSTDKRKDKQINECLSQSAIYCFRK